MLQKKLKNKKSKDNILSRNDIEKLRKVYQNYSTPLEVLAFDVKSIMNHEGVSKSKAINNIINILE